MNGILGYITLGLLTAIAAAMILVPPENTPEMDTNEVHFVKRERVGVWVDPLNGCQYLLWHQGGIAARLHSDGYPVCSEKK